MNTDQQERAAYQRAIEAAKNELADLRRRAEQAESLALTLQQQRDQAEADTVALWGCLSALIAHGLGGLLSPEDADAVQRVLIDHPGAALLAELEAARLALEEIRARPKMPSVRLLEAIFADYDAAVKASRS